LVKDTSSAATILADAWQKQAEAAGLAATMAVRKAAASSEAFYADTMETEATLNQAVADEEGAAQAILYAKATQNKSVAATENAAAQEASTAATGAAISPIGMLLGVVVAIGAAFYIWNERVKSLTDSMSKIEVA